MVRCDRSAISPCGLYYARSFTLVKFTQKTLHIFVDNLKQFTVTFYVFKTTEMNQGATFE